MLADVINDLEPDALASTRFIHMLVLVFHGAYRLGDIGRVTRSTTTGRAIGIIDRDRIVASSESAEVIAATIGIDDLSDDCVRRLGGRETDVLDTAVETQPQRGQDSGDDEDAQTSRHDGMSFGCIASGVPGR